MVSKTPSCSDLHDQSDVRFGWTIIVVIGTVISNIPQQYRIARRRSAEGVSAYFLATGLVSATCGLANIAILSLDLFECCTLGRVTSYECTSAVMGVVLSFTQWLVMAVMYVPFCSWLCEMLALAVLSEMVLSARGNLPQRSFVDQMD